MRGDNPYQSYPINVSKADSKVGNGYDHPLVGQDEEWISKKKVETITRKNLERQLKRQVVLNDGRVIVEDDPVITNDLTEDTQVHEDDGSDDIRMSSIDRSHWSGSRGGTVLGERFERNINTFDVSSKSSTTAAANNLGEITHDGVNKVVNDGRDVKNFVSSYPSDNRYALTIPARVIHKNKSHNRTVNKEDVHEVNRMHEGRLKTDRYVTKETIEDRNGETPEEGSSTESESYDGDAHGYKNRKEERYIDYYKVQPGRPITEGKHIRRGIHMRSEDKDAGKIDPWNKRSKNTALTYHDQSDSTSDKPPRPYERKNKKSHSRDGHRRFPSSERSYPTASARSNRRSELTSNRFHTIERSEKVGKSKNKNKMSTGYRRYDGGRHSDSDRSYRSRSMSRSSAENDHYRNGRSMRSDLDSERESRLKRAFSFNSRSSTGNGNRQEKYSESNKSFVGSVKSLYSTIKKSAKKKADELFENKPSRPPRKHENGNGSSISNGPSRPHSVYSDNATGRSWSGFTGGSWNRSNSRKPAARSQNNLNYNSNNSRTENTFVDTTDMGRKGKKVTRRKTMGAFDERMRENRDPPKFEESRIRRQTNYGSSSGRFFGQDDDVVERERIAPDMRRHLLDNVNLSRKKSMSSKDLDYRPSIRVI